jgi:hypothetical protein
MNFPVGTTGTIEFICPFYLFDSDGNEIQAPFSELVTVNSTEETVTLLSGVDPDVVPNPWSYTVKINLNGANEFIAYVEMPLTAADFMDVFNPTQPSTPEYYVLKSDYLAHVDEVGGPGGGLTEEEVQDLIDASEVAHEAEANPHAVYLTQAEADALYADAADITSAISTHSGAVDPHGDRAFATSAVNTEAGTRASADTALDGRLDVVEPAVIDHETRIDDLELEDIALDGRLDTAETDITALEAADVALDGRLDTAESDINILEAADAALDTRLDAEEALSVTFDSRLDTHDTDIAAKAPLADPTFTGTPDAPTATVGTNTTQLATTAFVQTASGLLVPKSLYTGKGVILAATAADTPAAHAAPSTGQFIVGNTANSDGLENRVLAYTDIPAFPKGTMSVGTKVVSTGTDTIMGLTADTNPGVTVSQTHAFHSDSTNRSRMTIPSGLDGDYLCIVAANLGGTDSGGSRRARLLKNGSTLATLTSPDAPAAIPAIESVTAMAVGLVAGDYLEVQVFQDSGGALNFTMSGFTIIRIP